MLFPDARRSRSVCKIVNTVAPVGTVIASAIESAKLGDIVQNADLRFSNSKVKVVGNTRTIRQKLELHSTDMQQVLSVRV